MIHGGVATNVVPAEIRLTFDMRLAIDVDHDKFKRDVKK